MWHYGLITCPRGRRYFSPVLVKEGKVQYKHITGVDGLQRLIRPGLAPTGRGRYDLFAIEQRGK